MDFKLVSQFEPTGDQPQAIEVLSCGLTSNVPHQVLLGVTGSGKSYTMANVIERTQMPALIIEPNKTLAAQLYQELKEFFPNNAVHYFVSYYDYYQPEAYIPQSDTYIEKDAKINETIDRLRHEAVQDLMSRDDVIVVASVSCIYNIGSPEEYHKVSLRLSKGQKISRKDLFTYLSTLQYERNDVEFSPGTFRVRGESLDIYSVTGKEIIRLEMFGDHIDTIRVSSNTQDPDFKDTDSYTVFPAKFWITGQEKQRLALQNIKAELQKRTEELKRIGKAQEAERLEQRTNYDIEMIEESGYCHGIENYSSHMEFRQPGEPPYSLLSYFKEPFIVMADESHLTHSQIRAMSRQDAIRKQTLVDHGFRLPSAKDNRPLTFDEFLDRADKIISVSATPGPWELQQAGDHVAEQIVRPTGLLEPTIEIRPTEHQIKDVLEEVQKAKDRGQRSLVITLSKRLSEDTASYLVENGIKAQWLHSEIKTMERPSFLEDLRKGSYDAIVGVNLLREGLDLPEVALIAILDADKEGFLRNKTTLIQTMGRAARHLNGRVVLYADRTTESMSQAISEIERRREIQERYNKEHGITPEAIIKGIRKWSFGDSKKEAVKQEVSWLKDPEVIEKEMKKAAKDLDFERAAALRDLLSSMKHDK